MKNSKTVNILGIRGLPAAHGGFETFAGHLAPYLVARGWNVNVYCQLDPDANGVLQPNFEDDWHGIHRIHIGSSSTGSLGSIKFDWRCMKDAVKRPGVNLVLGYNTAIFGLLLRLRGRPMVMNMDGVEWKRAKWSTPIKAWFYVNEFVGARISNVPIADHPEISRHLRRHGCTWAEVIPYGAARLEDVPASPVEQLGLTPGRYFVSIARIEPENSILEIVRAFSKRKRDTQLVVLGRLDDANPYHAAVRAAASSNVRFVGAIYDKDTVAALRFHCLAYLHGHQVGGTNPSLVEALGAGNAVIANDNRFNRWVAGQEQFFFRDEVTLEDLLTRADTRLLPLSCAADAASNRHKEAFTLDGVNRQYEALLERFVQATHEDLTPLENA
jgi:glycosyltransferase involved in cell wall biosynthesis